MAETLEKEELGNPTDGESALVYDDNQLIYQLIHCKLYIKPYYATLFVLLLSSLGQLWKIVEG